MTPKLQTFMTVLAMTLISFGITYGICVDIDTNPPGGALYSFKYVVAVVSGFVWIVTTIGALCLLIDQVSGIE